MVIGIDASRAFLKERTGTENYSWEMIRALGRLSCVHTFVLYVRPGWDLGEFEKMALPANFKVKQLSLPKLWTQVGLAWATWVDSIDVLWVPAHTLPVLGNPKLKMIVTLHGIEYEHLPGAYAFGQNLHLTWSTRWATIRASRVVAVSDKTRKDLIAWLGTKSMKIVVIKEGVDIDRFTIGSVGQENLGPGLLNIDQSLAGMSGSVLVPSQMGKVTESKSLEEGAQLLKVYKPYVLFVGTLQPRKNLVKLIEAFGSLVANGNTEIKEPPDRSKSERFQSAVKTDVGDWSDVLDTLQLVIAGKLGWDYVEILEAPKRLGIEDRVHFLGFVSDEMLPVLYKNAALYVEPSLQEGFGLPVLEAMASGVPVVAANAGALPEIAGKAAIFVDPESIGSMVRGLKMGLGLQQGKVVEALRLQKSENGLSVREVLRSRGLVRVKQFSWGAAAKHLIKVIESL